MPFLSLQYTSAIALFELLTALLKYLQNCEELCSLQYDGKLRLRYQAIMFDVIMPGQ